MERSASPKKRPRKKYPAICRTFPSAKPDAAFPQRNKKAPMRKKANGTEKQPEEADNETAEGGAVSAVRQSRRGRKGLRLSGFPQGGGRRCSVLRARGAAGTDSALTGIRRSRSAPLRSGRKEKTGKPVSAGQRKKENRTAHCAVRQGIHDRFRHRPEESILRPAGGIRRGCARSGSPGRGGGESQLTLMLSASVIWSLAARTAVL